jgi:hypothetical protein
MKHSPVMNDSDLNISPELADRVAGELSPDEKLIWIGQPRSDLAVRPAYFLVPFGVVFVAFSLFWMVMAVVITFGLMAPCGIPFLAIGVALIVSPVWLRAWARKTVYAVSNRRAIIWQPGWFGYITVQSFTPSGLGQMSRTERPDGSGDLVFQVYTSGIGEDSRTITKGFMGIDRVREVEELVRRTLQGK